jgi:hypothetical protein
MSISAEEWEEWNHIFVTSVPPAPLFPIPSPEIINSLINEIYNVFNTACAATMKRKAMLQGFHPNGGMMIAGRLLQHFPTPQNKIIHT